MFLYARKFAVLLNSEPKFFVNVSENEFNFMGIIYCQLFQLREFNKSLTSSN